MSPKYLVQLLHGLCVGLGLSFYLLLAAWVNPKPVPRMMYGRRPPFHDDRNGMVTRSYDPKTGLAKSVYRRFGALLSLGP